MKKTLLYSTIILLLLVHCQKVSSEPRIVYEDIFDKASTISIDPNKAELIISDLVSKLKICNKYSIYYCFVNKHITFYVPKYNLKNQVDWKVNGLTYYSEGEKDIVINSKKTRVFNISLYLDDVKYQFLYSQENGLIAIGVFDKISLQGRIYLLKNKYGFGKN